MADSNSQPPRCPCGFYGSAQTMGLCSKCYREQKPGPGNGNAATCAEQQQRNSDAGSSTISITESDHKAESPLSQALNQMQTAQTTTGTSTQAKRQTPEKEQAEAACSSSKTPDTEQCKPSADSDTASEDSSTTGPLRGTKRKCDDEDADSTAGDQPPQKNKKRCFQCRCKMDLSLRAIGKCKCGYVFCQLHRLPEQHACIYDHKGKGREEARDKMVSPKKHLGTSLKRIDSDS